MDATLLLMMASVEYGGLGRGMRGHLTVANISNRQTAKLTGLLSLRKQRETTTLNRQGSRKPCCTGLSAGTQPLDWFSKISRSNSRILGIPKETDRP